MTDLKLRGSYGISGNDVIARLRHPKLADSLIQFSYNESPAAATAYGISPTIGNTEPEVGADQRPRTSAWTYGFFEQPPYRLDRLLRRPQTRDLIFPYTLPLLTGVTTVNRNIGRNPQPGRGGGADVAKYA